MAKKKQETPSEQADTPTMTPDPKPETKVETPKKTEPVKTVDPNLEVIKFLHESGLLFKINQQILHPHGLELTANIGPDGSCKGWNPVRDFRNDAKGVTFKRPEFVEGRKRFLEYMTQIGSDKLKDRLIALGYVTQDMK